jgi:exopolyphosphatase / guanosine-5'-triphosphate,3'-diphosphate pyrophosphatase
MLLGVLDIGSNSAQLQVFEARPGAPPLPTHAVKEPTLLGESFGPDGAIDPAGVDRVVEAVNHAMSAAGGSVFSSSTCSPRRRCGTPPTAT